MSWPGAAPLGSEWVQLLLVVYQGLISWIKDIVWTQEHAAIVNRITVFDSTCFTILNNRSHLYFSIAILNSLYVCGFFKFQFQ